VDVVSRGFGWKMQGKFEENPMENPEERGEQTFAFHLSAQSSAVLAHPDELVKD